MSGSDVTIASKKGDSPLVQARFGPGMLLHHDDLERLGAYPVELSRLLFRSFFGCGVVCGLVVKTETHCGKVCVTVDAGVALGCSGDPIWVPKPQTFPIDEKCDPNLPTPLYVVLCPWSKCCAPRTSSCGGEDGEEAPSVCTRERLGFEIRVVRERPACACGCEIVQTDNQVSHAWTTGGGPTTPGAEPRVVDCRCVAPNDPCYIDHYEGKCGCHCGDCTDCECQCVLLARLDKREGDLGPWQVDHRVRRFIRPVLMRDPQVVWEVQSVALRAAKKKEEEEAARREIETRVKEEAARREAEKKEAERKEAEERARREEDEKKRAAAAAEEARRAAEKKAAGERAAREAEKKPAARSRSRRTLK